MKQFGKVIKLDQHGAITHEWNAEEVRVSTKTQKEWSRGRDFKNFIMTMNEEVREVSKLMSLVESGAMFSIAVHLNFDEENFIMRKGHRATMQDIEEILRKDKRQVTRIIKRLEELDLVKRVKNGRTFMIQVNDKFHSMNGTTKGSSFTKIYTVKAKNLIEELELNELGLLYKIAPLFHTKDMVLCKNPYELDQVPIYMSTEDLAEEIQVNRATVFRLLPKLLKKGAIMKFESMGVHSYQVNPSIMFRGDRLSPEQQHLLRKFELIEQEARRNT